MLGRRVSASDSCVPSRFWPTRCHHVLCKLRFAKVRYCRRRAVLQPTCHKRGAGRAYSEETVLTLLLRHLHTHTHLQILHAITHTRMHTHTHTLSHTRGASPGVYSGTPTRYHLVEGQLLVGCGMKASSSSLRALHNQAFLAHPHRNSGGNGVWRGQVSSNLFGTFLRRQRTACSSLASKRESNIFKMLSESLFFHFFPWLSL